ncbi:MAG TPA: pyridoxamine 5'-phosphate oxidase family protein [Bosea sp. (in: a-proteobacteria)]
MAENPFHDGERAAQARAGVSSYGAGIRTFMPDQHRSFFAGLPWLFAGLVNPQGWPLATVLTGEPGFASSPIATTLSVRSLPAADDPAGIALRPGAPIGLLGIEFETRRRNRANGMVTARDARGFDVSVSQSFGNCAKYIQIRHRLGARPGEPGAIEPLAGLDDAARTMIAQADTLFIATATPAGHAGGGVDMSHRGGRTGFVRLDGETLTIPDFAGNRYFNTFGNLLLEPRAALLFVDFATGTTLQLQGVTEIIWSGDDVLRLDGAERLWRFHVERGWRRPHALPLRWSEPEFAPTTLETGLWRAAA